MYRYIVFSNVIFMVGVMTPALSAQEYVDYEMIDRIRDEGFNRSQVEDHLFYMTEMYGPRLSNSPVYDQAARWARDSFEDWGADTAKLEPYGPIGLGWEVNYVSVHMHSPQYQPFIAYAVRPTRGTDGKVMSEAVFVNTREIYSEAGLRQYRGKLRNKIIFTQPLREVEPLFRPLAVRLSQEELDYMAVVDLENAPPAVTITREEYDALVKGKAPPQPLETEIIHQFFEDEGVAVLVNPRCCPASGRLCPVTRCSQTASYHSNVDRTLQPGHTSS